MTNSELWEQYSQYTEQASSVARQLGFAAAGLIWAFRDTGSGWTEKAQAGLVFVVAFFITDLLQYVIAAVRRRLWIRGEEIKKWNETQSIEGDYNVPVTLDRPAFWLWWIKLGFLIVAYIFVALTVLA